MFIIKVPWTGQKKYKYLGGDNLSTLACKLYYQDYEADLMRFSDRQKNFMRKGKEGSNEEEPSQESQRLPDIEPVCKDCDEDVAYGGRGMNVIEHVGWSKDGYYTIIIYLCLI